MKPAEEAEPSLGHSGTQHLLLRWWRDIGSPKMTLIYYIYNSIQCVVLCGGILDLWLVRRWNDKTCQCIYFTGTSPHFHKYVWYIIYMNYFVFTVCTAIEFSLVLSKIFIIGRFKLWEDMFQTPSLFVVYNVCPLPTEIKMILLWVQCVLNQPTPTTQQCQTKSLTRNDVDVGW